MVDKIDGYKVKNTYDLLINYRDILLETTHKGMNYEGSNLELSKINQLIDYINEVNK